MEENKIEETKEVKVEKKESKKNKVDNILNKLIIFFGVIFIIAGGITIGDKLAGDDCSCPNTSKSNKEETVITASKEKYEFDYANGLIPGTSYKGYIDLKTGDAKVEATAGCSTLDCEINEPEVYEGKIDIVNLNKIIKYLEKYNYPSTTEVINKDIDFRNKQVKFMYLVIETIKSSSYSSQFDELLA